MRRYSSQDAPEQIDPKSLNVPSAWARTPRVLSASPGMHRWVWDLHYPVPAVEKRDLPISAVPHDTPLEPLGPRALPGEYTVKLIAAGQTLTQKLTVKMDPRVATPQSGLAQQFELEMKVADALRQDSDALRQVRSIRSQIKALLTGAKLLPGSVASPINELDKTLAALEGSDQGYGAPADFNSLVGLNTSLTTVYENVDSADAQPTSQAVAIVGDLQKALATVLAHWQEVKTRELPTLNEKLRSADLQEIKID